MADVAPLRSPQRTGESGNGGNRTHTVERRLAALETHIQYLATRGDIEKLKNPLLEKNGSRDRWLIGVMIAAILPISLAVIRTFFS